MKVAVYIEAGAKRTFASAVEWPGWSRGARDEAGALTALGAYGPRYARVVKDAVPTFAAPGDASSFEVIGRVKGDASTDFGVPAMSLPSDSKPISAKELARFEALLRACWAALKSTARGARGIELRKGPRGGGRDLDKILAHVIEAEEAYLAALGARRPRGPDEPPASKAARLRDAVIDAFRARARGQPLAEPNKVKRPWTPRYFVRRAAWHVLDHAWEIEDRAQ